jgi:ribonucleoside-diphosphate reductase alpha chain
LQAGYTDFKYLSKESQEIFREEALLGCSITGMMDNPDLLFDEEIQK